MLSSFFVSCQLPFEKTFKLSAFPWPTEFPVDVLVFPPFAGFTVPFAAESPLAGKGVCYLSLNGGPRRACKLKVVMQIKIPFLFFILFFLSSIFFLSSSVYSTDCGLDQ